MKLFNKDKKNDKSNKSLKEKAWDLQHDLEKRQERIGKGKYGRVLKMARNPTDEEYAKTSKITGLGILLVGGLGFLIWLIVEIGVPKVAEFLGLV